MGVEHVVSFYRGLIIHLRCTTIDSKVTALKGLMITYYCIQATPRLARLTPWLLVIVQGSFYKHCLVQTCSRGTLSFGVEVEAVIISNVDV